MHEIDKYDLYSTRLLVFMETEPQSNKYRQVVLDKDEFKRVSDAVCGGPVPNGMEEEEVEIYMTTDVYELPDLNQIEEHE